MIRNFQNALARLSGRAFPPSILCHDAAPIEHKARPAKVAPIAPETGPAWVTQHLVEHDAPDGAHVPRYGPKGFPAPVWSAEDLARPDARRYTAGSGPRAGHVLLRDGRKAWQKKGLSVSWDREGIVCRYKGRLTDTIRPDGKSV